MIVGSVDAITISLITPSGKADDCYGDLDEVAGAADATASSCFAR